jgi:2-dehydropantoate 2-reductase
MDAFPDNVVLRAMVPFNIAQLADNHLHRGSGGALPLEYHPRLAALGDALRTPLMPLQFSRDMEATLWAKLQLNLVNAINALSDVPVRAMLEQRGYRRAFAACMRELLRVTTARGIRLPKLTALPAYWLPRMLELPDWLFRLLARPMLEVDPTVRTSMWWDLSQGRPTEIDYLNGAVVTHGRRAGVPTPVNERVVRLVHAVETGSRPAGIEPAQLLRELGLG